MQRSLPLSMSRREFLRVAGMGSGSLFILASCGTSTSSGTVTLTFWLPGGSQTYCATHNKIEQDFTKLHPNIKMNPVLCGTGQQDFNQVLLARIAAGNPPDASISFDSPVSMGARGALEPLDAMMNTSQYSKVSDWPSAVLASCQYQGKTYGLPMTAGTYAMWYNQEMFEKKGIPTDPASFPKTWDELRRLSKEFVQWDGDKLVTAGFLPPYVGGEIDQNQLAIFSALNGSQIYDAANRKYTIDSENNVAMMQFFVDWLDEQYKGDINKVIRSGAWGAYPGSQGQPPAFQNGQQAMILDGSWLMGDFYSSITPKFTNWSLAQLPVGPGGSKPVSGYWPNWALIPHGSQHKQEAFEYLDYLSAKGILRWFNTIPDMPANKNVARDLLPQIVVDKRGKDFAQQAISFFYQQQEIVTPMWDSPIQTFATDQLRQALDRTLKKAMTPKQAMQQAQQACQSNLDALISGK